MLENAAPAKKGSLLGNPLGSLVALYEQRWLVAYFVQRQLTRSYQGSFLGFLWVFLSPLLLVALYTLVFSQIIGIRFNTVAGDSSLNFGLYLYCGLLPFMAYSETMSQSVNIVRSNASLVQKVVFPSEMLPLTSVITAFIDKLFGLSALLVVLVVLNHRLEWTLLLLPPFLMLQLIFNLGLSYFFAVVGAYLPDVREALNTVVRASFFITPIFWSADRVHGKMRLVVDLNPVAYLVGMYRDLVLEGKLPNGMATLWFGLFSVGLLAVGFTLFVRVKRQFPDLI